MKVGIHSPSFIYNVPNICDAIKKKVFWIEEHGFDWFSVMEHWCQSFLPRWQLSLAVYVYLHL